MTTGTLYSTQLRMRLGAHPSDDEILEAVELAIDVAPRGEGGQIERWGNECRRAIRNAAEFAQAEQDARAKFIHQRLYLNKALENVLTELEHIEEQG